MLIGAGLCGWFIAGPYTFLDSYYLRSLFVVWSTVYATPFGEATLLVWFNALRSNVGNVACAAGLAVIYALWTARDPRRDPAPLLAVVIALSQLLWFGSASKVWTVRISAGRDWTRRLVRAGSNRNPCAATSSSNPHPRMGSNHHGRAVGRVDSDAPWHRTDQHGAGTASLAPLDGNGSQPLGLRGTHSTEKRSCL